MIALAKAKGTPGDNGKDGINGMRGADGINGMNGIDGLRGADGAHGAKGLDGSKGEIGAVGPQGDKGEAGMIWRGTYRSDIEYWIGDVVGVSGSAYVCIASTNQAPPVGFGWELLVSRGAQGIRGIKGEDGTGGGGAAAAGTLTGATLAANVVNSSLTSVGTLTGLTVTATIIGDINGSADSAVSAFTANVVTDAAQTAITSVGTLTAVNTSGVITGTNTTASTSSTTGALIIAGGVGIAKDSFINSVKAGIGFTGADASNVTNTSFGNAASDSATGTQNTAIGNRSLRGNTASNVTGIGYFSADGNSGTGLCAFGGFAGYSNSGNNVTAFGYAAAYDCAANNNVAIGDSALSAGPCTGVDNTCGGYFSARLMTSGTLNSAWGANSLSALTTGASNCGIGSTAGSNLTTGSNNTIIGAAATVAAAGNDNSIVIGKSAVGLGSNTTVIGTSSTTETKLFGQLTLDATACISAASATALALKTVVPAGTGVTPTIQVICPSAAFALQNVATTQAVFNTPVDTISLQAATTYMFEGQYLLQTGTTSHTTTISFVSSVAITPPSIAYTTIASAHSSPNASNNTQTTSFFTSIAGGIVASAATSPNMIISFKGIIRATDAGNLVPNILFSVAPGAAANFTLIGSYIRFYPIGANTIDSVGTAIS